MLEYVRSKTINFLNISEISSFHEWYTRYMKQMERNKFFFSLLFAPENGFLINNLLFSIFRMPAWNPLGPFENLKGNRPEHPSNPK